LTYFREHLTALRNYYLEVSNNEIRIGFEIFPAGDFGSFKLDREMAFYSPGSKRNDETFDDYYVRQARALMHFVSQSIDKAHKSEKNPFADLEMDSKGRLSKDGIPVFILLIHAGSSALTDGGHGGMANADSPSDITATFISEELFKYFNSPRENIFSGLVERDPITGVTGAKVSGKDNTIFISEAMMVSETANQDSLNWGINGILVNQFARQIGIPDLFSTSSGTTGVGSFCVMDFYGYSAASGFIPPNPSAFVRAYMGWDEPIMIKPDGSNHRLDVFGNNLYLIPLNNTEYYLIENRQRNLTGDPQLFAYDTLSYILSGLQVNLERNVALASRERSVIMEVKSRDIGMPASGALVWHVDEKLIKNRIEYNMLNSDSSYRAVALKEADGVIDIGVEFADMLGVPWYDYGGAADVFPHRNSFDSRPVSEMGPRTKPSTAANDGGNTYLRLSFSNSVDPNTAARETYRFSRSSSGKHENYTVTNLSDSVIILNVSLDRDHIMPSENFPIKVKGSDFYPLLTANVLRDGNGTFNEIVALSKQGDLSVISQSGEIVFEAENILPVNMPSFIGNNLMIPSKNRIMIYNGEDGRITVSQIDGINPSSYIVGLNGENWVVGTSDGNLIYGQNRSIDRDRMVKLDETAINSIAIIDENAIAAVSQSGNVFVVSNATRVDTLALPNASSAFAPFKLAVSENRIIASDNRQGLWFLTYENGIGLNENQREFPIDWAGIFRDAAARNNIPENRGFLSMAELNNDGVLHLLVGGTNGVYAFDEKGYLLENYPALLDRAEWYIRKSVQSTPISARTSSGETLVFFTTTTGDSRSYYQTKIDSADLNRGVVYFNDINERPDSIVGLSRGYIDTLLTLNDSLILPYFAPGGLIDIRSGRTGKRPEIAVSTQNAGRMRFFPYLISIGEPLSQGVVLDDLDGSVTLDLIAVSDNGMLYRFGLPRENFAANQTNMTGGNAARQFNFKATGRSAKLPSKSLEYFYSYPNPVRIRRGENGLLTFRYELGDNASSAHLTIYTIQGQKVFEERNLPLSRGVNEYVLRDLSRFGSAVYRCRLSIKFGNEEKVLFWKTAILR
jgi:hypothetical protein